MGKGDSSSSSEGSPSAASSSTSTSSSVPAATAKPAKKGSSKTKSKSLDTEALYELVDPKNPKLLAELGGVEGLAEKLRVDLKKGLSSKNKEDLKERQEKFGVNALPEQKLLWFIQFVWENLGDKMLILLLVCSGISIGLGWYGEHEEGESWTSGAHGSIEGWVIFLAVSIVVSVASLNDWQKQRQFKSLSDSMKAGLEVVVLRDGEKTKIPQADLVVGDVLWVETGDLLPGDAIFISGSNIKADESAFTGESDQIHKGHDAEGHDPIFLSNSQILDGAGLALCIGVGVSSFNGRIMVSIMGGAVKDKKKKEGETSESSESSSEDDDENDGEGTETPLEIKLSALADLIGICGMVAAGSLLIALIIIYFVTHAVNNEDFSAKVVLPDVMHFIITAITIVVVAVPEGLPLAVTIALAYSMKKMMVDKNLVRHLKACETMGGASNICTDKTGTLTLNQMRVVAGLIQGTKWVEGETPEFSEHQLIIGSIALNTTVYFDPNKSPKEEQDPKAEKKAAKQAAKDKKAGKPPKKKKKPVGMWEGNKTELALVDFLETSIGVKVNDAREADPILHRIPFSSERKRMSSAIRTESGIRVFSKGASEIMLELCTKIVKEDGTVAPLSKKDKKKFAKTIDEFGGEALRVIGLAYKDLDEEPDWETWHEDDLTLVGIVGIKDPLRPEVPQAVADCQKAGILVRMVTGDNLVTAKNIAKNAGILTEGGIAIEGPDFRKLSRKEIDKILPKLQVLARSSPLDKKLLVQSLRRHDLVVAVTGDGTNDAPALKLADVGFSMGIAGTEVAKQASDIVLLNDNFASIVKAVLWGRNVYDGIRKFVQFQLTVNVVAVLIAYIGAVSDAIAGGEGESPLTPVQLLWVNLIMDTFAALALATDPPRPELLDRKPYRKTESIISLTMWKNILGQAIFQLSILLLILYHPGSFISPTPHSGDFGDLTAQSAWCIENRLSFDRYADECPQTDAAEQCQCQAEIYKRIWYSFIFNTFVWMQVFNELNARRIRDVEKNIFSGFFTNYIFIGVVVGTGFFQAVYVNVFGEPGGVHRLDWDLWLWSLGFGMIALPLGQILKFLPTVIPFLREQPQSDVNNLEGIELDEEDDSSSSSYDKSSSDKDSSSSSSSASGEKLTESGWEAVRRAAKAHTVLTAMEHTAKQRAHITSVVRKHRDGHSGFNE